MRYCFASLILLAACDMGGPGFRGVDPMRVSIDGSQFSVRQADGRVEVLRTNSEIAFQRQGMTAKMVQAIELTTGCTLVEGSLRGDQVQATGRLKCAGKAASSRISAGQTLICKTPASATRNGVTTVVTELDCF